MADVGENSSGVIYRTLIADNNKVYLLDRQIFLSAIGKVKIIQCDVRTNLQSSNQNVCLNFFTEQRNTAKKS